MIKTCTTSLEFCFHQPYFGPKRQQLDTMETDAWGEHRGGRRRTDGMQDKRASIDGRPAEGWNDGYQSVACARRSMDQGNRYDVANTSHGNLNALEEQAEEVASKAEALHLPRRPVGLTGDKPSRSESAQLGDNVFANAPATRDTASIPSDDGIKSKMDSSHEGQGVGAEYTPSSYFASRAASGALDRHATSGVDRQSSHLNLQDLDEASS